MRARCFPPSSTTTSEQHLFNLLRFGNTAGAAQDDGNPRFLLNAKAASRATSSFTAETNELSPTGKRFRQVNAFTKPSPGMRSEPKQPRRFFLWRALCFVPADQIATRPRFKPPPFRYDLPNHTECFFFYRKQTRFRTAETIIKPVGAEYGVLFPGHVLRIESSGRDGRAGFHPEIEPYIWISTLLGSQSRFGGKLLEN